jgi:predicted O-methyltransferase YrrM
MKDADALRNVKDLAYGAGRPIYQAVLAAATARARSFEDFLAVTERVRFRGYTIRAYQKRAEILGVLDRVQKMRARVVVELGTARGGTLYLLCRAAEADATVVSIDLPDGGFGAGFREWKMPLLKSFAGRGQDMHFLRGDSQTTEMVERLRGVLDGRLIDFILIDGDHRYEGVKRDFELYSPLVRPGGLIAFHDIVTGDPKKVGGVPEFWREIRAGYEHEELVESWEQGGFGIGLIRWPGAA